MCGIALAFNFDGTPVNEKIHDIYQNQRSRGTEGYGMAAIIKENDKTKLKIFRSTNELSAMMDLKMPWNRSPLILFHHRTPTSTENQVEQTHPILVQDGSFRFDYLVVHNGIIQNADKLKEEHEKLGLLYSTQIEEPKWINSAVMEIKFNDSESLAFELARYLEGQIEKPGSIGSAAFILLQLDKATGLPVALYFGRNSGNPLRYGRNSKNIVIASEKIGTEIEAHKIHCMDLKDTAYPITVKDCTLQTYEYPSTPRNVGFNTTPAGVVGQEEDDDYRGATNCGYDNPALMLPRKHKPTKEPTTPEEKIENEMYETDTLLIDLLEQFYETFTDDVEDFETVNLGHDDVDKLAKDLKGLIEIYQYTATEKYHLENIIEDTAAINETTQLPPPAGT